MLIDKLVVADHFLQSPGLAMAQARLAVERLSLAGRYSALISLNLHLWHLTGFQYWYRSSHQ